MVLSPRHIGAWFALLLVLGVGFYFPVLNAPFMFDDIAKIRDNPDIHQPTWEWSRFVHSYSTEQRRVGNDPSRPVTFMAYWAFWQIDKGSPLTFHLASVLVHVLNAFMLGLLLAKRVRWAVAVPTGLAFLFAPVFVGTVAYIYSFSDVLVTFWILLGLVAIEWRSRGEYRKWVTQTALGLLYLLALFTKQSAIVYPLLVFVVFGRRTNYSFAVVGPLYLIWRKMYFGSLGDLEAISTFEPSTYLTLQGFSLMQYAKWIIWPTNLAIDHALSPVDFTWNQCLLAWSLLASITAAVVVWTSNDSWWRTGWFFFLVALLPTSSLFPTTDLLVERRAYLAGIGVLLMLVGWAGSPWPWRPRVGLTALWLMVAMGVGLGWSRVQVYADEEHVWQETLAQYPRNERARLNLSHLLLKQERWGEAAKALNELLKLYPNYYGALTQMGAFYQHPKNPHRDLGLAKEYYKRSLTLEPAELSALNNLGFLHLELGQPQEARQIFLRILSLRPGHAGALMGLARIK